MQNKIVLVTGATSGIGYQTALALAKMGAQVILTGRNRKNAEEAVVTIQRESGNVHVAYLLADLSKQAEVRALAKAFQQKYSHLESYSQSKLAMMAVMYEYSQREKGITINVCYPGQASTRMTRGVTAEMFPGLMRFIFPIFRMMTRPDQGKSAAKAARSSIYLASSAEVEGRSGIYYDTNSKQTPWPPAVLDPDIRVKLWTSLERFT